MNLPTLRGSVAMLRAPIPSDQADRQLCGRDEDYLRGMGDDTHQASDRLTDAEAEDWYRRLVDDPFCWIIEAGGRAVGTVRVHHQSEKDRNTRVGIGIFDRAWRGKGLGTEALRLFLGHAFGELGLHRVELHVLEHNAAARRSYVKAGFTEEGTARDSAWIGGRFCSHVRMSILENEYRAMERKPPE